MLLRWVDGGSTGYRMQMAFRESCCDDGCANTQLAHVFHGLSVDKTADREGKDHLSSSTGMGLSKSLWGPGLPCDSLSFEMYDLQAQYLISWQPKSQLHATVNLSTAANFTRSNGHMFCSI